MANYNFETTVKFKNRGDMDKAEDWIQANVKGLWALEFIGMQEQMSVDTGMRSQVLLVLFKFGRKEDFERFCDEYAPRKPARPQPKPQAKAAPKKSKGLLGWLFS